jgi:plastocyanin
MRRLSCAHRHGDTKAVTMKHPSLISLALAATALALGACGSSGPEQSTGGHSILGNQKSTYAAGVTNAATPIHHVTVTNRGFSPATITIRLNDAVWVENDDITDHTVTSISGEKIRSGFFGKGSTYRFSPTRTGTIEYIDTLHPQMHGEIVVR